MPGGDRPVRIPAREAADPKRAAALAEFLRRARLPADGFAFADQGPFDFATIPGAEAAAVECADAGALHDIRDWAREADRVLALAAEHDDTEELARALFRRGRGGAWSCRHDLLGVVFGLLQGWDERLHGRVDAHGRPDPDAGLLARHGLLRRPAADEICRAAGFAIARAAKRPDPPSTAPWTFALTFDIDSAGLLAGGRWASGTRWLAREQGAWGLLRGLGLGAAVNAGLARDPHHNWGEAALALASDGVRATVFVQAFRAHALDNYALRRETALVRAMRAWRTLGWEAGLHSSYAAPDRDAAFLRRQCRAVERALGGRVRAVRGHYLRGDGAGHLRACAEASLRVEASCGFSTVEGFRRGTAHPWQAWDDNAGRPFGVLRVPVHLMDVTLRAHRGLDAERASAAARRILARCAESGGIGVALWHPHNLDGRWGRGWDRMPQALVRIARQLGGECGGLPGAG